jgi:hypothetical protein
MMNPSMLKARIFEMVKYTGFSDRIISNGNHDAWELFGVGFQVRPNMPPMSMRTEPRKKPGIVMKERRDMITISKEPLFTFVAS